MKHFVTVVTIDEVNRTINEWIAANPTAVIVSHSVSQMTNQWGGTGYYISIIYKD